MLPQTLLLLTLPSPPGSPRVRGSERRSERQSPFFEEPEVAWDYCQGVPYVAPPAEPLRCTHELYLRCSTGPSHTAWGSNCGGSCPYRTIVRASSNSGRQLKQSEKRNTRPLPHSLSSFQNRREAATWRPNPIFNFAHGSQEVLHFPHSQKLSALLSSVGRRATKKTVENGWISDS